MSRPSRLSFDEMSDKLNVFIDDSREKYGTHAFAVGYLSSVLANTLILLPRHQQLLVMEALKHTSVYK